jgi:hypothetical protein
MHRNDFTLAIGLQSHKQDILFNSHLEGLRELWNLSLTF